MTTFSVTYVYRGKKQATPASGLSETMIYLTSIGAHPDCSNSVTVTCKVSSYKHDLSETIDLSHGCYDEWQQRLHDMENDLLGFSTCNDGRP